MLKMFEPAKIGKLELKNRIIFLPMGDGLQSETRGVSQKQIAYFEERARGGAGLIMMASNPKNDHGLQGWNMDINGEDKVEGLRALTDAIHKHGAKAGVMLGLGFGGMYPNFDGSMPKTPSRQPLLSDPTLYTDPFTREEIYTIIEQYGQSAAWAKAGGYDLVHIQGYGAYLIDMFTCEKWNHRDDEFGGSLENRMRFPLMLVDSIKRHCGDDYPIIYKFSPVHLVEGGRTMEDAIIMVKRLEEAGVSAIQIDVGKFPEKVYHLIPTVYEERPGVQFEYAAEIKKHVSIPVYTQGCMGDPQDALAMLEAGKTDFVGLGRSLLADPSWPEKVRNEQVQNIRPCICCNEGCIMRLMEDKTISCAVNPRGGFERERNLCADNRPDAVKEPKKIMIVGGGAGGMAAAIYASKCGWQSEIYEKSSYLGGKLLPASAPEFKKKMGRLNEYLKAQIYSDKNIKVHFMHEVTAEEIKSSNADLIVISTGAGRKPKVSAAPKADAHSMSDITAASANSLENSDALDWLEAEKVLMGKEEIGNSAVVVGGGYIGCETALYLKRQGKDVRLVVRSTVLREKAALQNELNMRALLRESGIEIWEQTDVVSHENGILKIRKRERGDAAPENAAFTGDHRPAGIIMEPGEYEIPCDSLICAFGLKPDNSLIEELFNSQLSSCTDACTLKQGDCNPDAPAQLYKEFPLNPDFDNGAHYVRMLNLADKPVSIIGDGLHPGRVLDAVWGAWEAVEWLRDNR